MVQLFVGGAAGLSALNFDLFKIQLPHQGVRKPDCNKILKHGITYDMKKNREQPTSERGTYLITKISNSASGLGCERVAELRCGLNFKEVLIFLVLFSSRKKEH